jgi:hypothetical protein
MLLRRWNQREWDRKLYHPKIKISNSSSVGNPKKKIKVGRARRRCEDIIQIRLKNTRCKGVDCIHLAENSLVSVNTATNPSTPQMAENFLSLSLSRRTPCVSRFNDRPSSNDEALESQNHFSSHTNIDRVS